MAQSYTKPKCKEKTHITFYQKQTWKIKPKIYVKDKNTFNSIL